VNVGAGVIISVPLATIPPDVISVLTNSKAASVSYIIRVSYKIFGFGGRGGTFVQ